MPIPKSFTTVTTFSKLLAMFLFIALPFLGFYLGVQYEKKVNPVLYNTHFPEKPYGEPTGSVKVTDKIASIYRHGGDCPEGACSSTITVDKDGAVENGPKTVSNLTPAQINQLQNLISTTDFEKIKINKFTGKCPITYDGQETIYTFYLSKNTQTLASCTYTIDPNAPLFSFISKNILSIQYPVLPSPTSAAPEFACTQEAKLCPDGTSVGRKGPKCEFADCPAKKN